MENKSEKKTMRAPLFIVAAMLESAAVAAAVKENRPILCAVNLSSDAAGDTLTAVATDSARLNRIIYDLSLDAQNKNKNIAVSGGFSVNLAPAAINKIISLNKESEKANKNRHADYKYFELATIEKDGDAVKLTIEDANGQPVTVCALESIPGDYPVTSKIIPETKGAFMSFNPSFLGDLKKSAKALKCAGDMVTMQAPSAPMRPFIVDYQSGIENIKAVALITPMRPANSSTPGFDYLASGGAAVAEYKNKIQALESRVSYMEEENARLNAELQKALRTEDKPAAANGADIDFMREKLQATEKRLKDAEKLTDELTAKNRNLITETAALTADNGEKAARVADLESKYTAANATIHEKHAENIRLLNKIKELEKALKEAQTATAAAPVEKKKDGGQEPATDRQRAYIAKLGGTLPDGATIRDASILITQLKKSRVCPSA